MAPQWNLENQEQSSLWWPCMRLLYSPLLYQPCHSSPFFEQASEHRKGGHMRCGHDGQMQQHESNLLQLLDIVDDQ